MKGIFKKSKRYLFFSVFYVTIFMFISTLMIIVLTKPEGKVKVPSIRGEKFTDVYNSLVRKELKPVIKFYDTTDKESGLILDQYPTAGTIINKGTRLKIIVSRNNLKVKVPSLEGSELPVAINKLKKMHVGDKTISLGVGVVSYIPSDKKANNIVISQSPKSGEKISPEQKVNLLVSAGKLKDNMRMPSVTGQSIDLVYELLLSKGVKIYEKFIPVSSRRNGKVISQKPYRNARIKKGSSVWLTIGYTKTSKHYYSGYERYSYTIPENEKSGLYEVYVEDEHSKRLRFSRKMKPGQKISLIFHRTGNSKIVILCDKVAVKVDSIKVEAFF